MRLRYVADPPPTNNPQEVDILARVRKRRAPNGLLLLDRALLHSYPVANGWNCFIGSIRSQTTITVLIRELIICRVAVLNRAIYEWEQHAPLLIKAGVNDATLQVVRDAEADILSKMKDKILGPTEAAVLRYTDAMTKTVTVPDEVFQDIKNRFSDQEVVEITMTAAAYNCVSRFLVALDIEDDKN